MLISQMTTDTALDGLCELVPYLSSIAADTAIADELRRKIDPEQAKTSAGMLLEGMKKVNTLVPLLLETHRDDIYHILSVVNGVPAEEIGRQNILKTGAQLLAIMRDKDLLNFFESWVDTGASV